MFLFFPVFQKNFTWLRLHNAKLVEIYKKGRQIKPASKKLRILSFYSSVRIFNFCMVSWVFLPLSTLQYDKLWIKIDFLNLIHDN